MCKSINSSDLGQRSNNDLDLWYSYIIMYSLIKSTICTNFQFTAFNSFHKNLYLSIFPYKSIREQRWSFCKVGQGQHRIIIWTNFVGPESPMLYTKLEGHRPAGFGYEDFYSVFTSHLGHMTRTVWTNFRSPMQWSLHMKFGFHWFSGFWGEDVWRVWTMDDRPRTPTEPAYTTSSSMNLKA